MMMHPLRVQVGAESIIVTVETIVTFILDSSPNKYVLFDKFFNPKLISD